MLVSCTWALIFCEDGNYANTSFIEDGLERLLRLVQSALQLAYILLPSLATFTFSFPWSFVVLRNLEGPKPSHDLASTSLILKSLQVHLGLSRRMIRLFRFLDAFHSAYALYATKTASTLALVSWLDVIAHSSNGLYLFLESITILDALSIPGLRVWGPDYTSLLKVESQRYWFFALIATSLSSAIRLYQMRSKGPFIAARGSDSSKAREKKVTDSPVHESQIHSNKSPVHRSDLIILDAEILTTWRKLLATSLDLTIPGSTLGWIPVSSTVVSSSMFITSFLTGYEVWKRCGSVG